MKIVGKQNRSEIELDPIEACRRGTVLDAMLRDAFPPFPRGVMRATHAEFNRIDDERQIEQARILNGSKPPSAANA
jgi:hypothetical protein